MNHAEHLQGMASDERILAGRENARSTSLLSGADALDTLDRVRHALSEIDRRGDDASAVWERDADMYEQGRSDAYHHAHTLITEALERKI